MQEFVGSGRVVDLLLLLVGAEVVALVLYHRWTGRGVAPRSVLLNLASGAFLLLAMRAGLAGLWWGWVSLCLAAAGLLHAADLRRLWR